jgi:hypothetical protein
MSLQTLIDDLLFFFNLSLQKIIAPIWILAENIVNEGGESESTPKMQYFFLAFMNARRVGKLEIYESCNFQ